jgi:hypothetical protein
MVQHRCENIHKKNVSSESGMPGHFEFKRVITLQQQHKENGDSSERALSSHCHVLLVC